MAQVYLTTSEAELLSEMIHKKLSSGAELSEDGTSVDAITQCWIMLGVKAVKAGAPISTAHALVKEQIKKQS